MPISQTVIESWKVFISEEPWADLAEWTEFPEILPVVARRCLFPEVSFTKFEYLVGNFVKHFQGLSAGVKSPIAKMRWFIRLQVFNAAEEMLDDWIGIISRTDLEKVLGGTANPTGNLYFTAFGVESELNLKTITESRINDSEYTATGPDDAVVIPRGIGFNVDPLEPTAGIGNRHTQGPRLFSRRPNVDVPDPNSNCSFWTAEQAIEYTIFCDAGKWVSDGTTLPANQLQWRLKKQTDIFSSVPVPSVERDRKTVGEVLREIIPKKSGILTKVVFEVPDSGDTTLNQDKLVFFLEYFSASKTAVTLSGATIPQAPLKIDFDTRTRKDILELTVSESAYEKFDVVVGEGALTTTTFSGLVSFLNPAWGSDDELDFLNPDVSSVDTDGEKQKLADDIRADRKFSEVFRTFVLDSSWAKNPIDSITWSLVPAKVNQTDFASAADIPTIYSTSHLSYLEDNYTHKALLPDMRWPVRPAAGIYNQPLVFVPVNRVPSSGAINFTDSDWAEGSQLNKKGGWFEERQWTVRIETGRSVSVSEDSTYSVGPSISLDVQGGHQLFMARGRAGTVVHLTPQNDPANTKNSGVNYDDFVFTACYETDVRIKYEHPPAPTVISGAPLRKKYLRFDWLRLDVQLPNTITKVDQSGAFVYDTTGVILRDDRRDLFLAVYHAFEANYSLSKRPFSLTLSALEVGDMKPGVFVENIQTAAGTDATNVIISQIEYDFRGFTTRVSTEFEEIDVQFVAYAGRFRR